MITDLTIIGNKIIINSNKDDILTADDPHSFPLGVKLTVNSIKINNGTFDLDYTVVDTRLKYNTMYNIYDIISDRIMKTGTTTSTTCTDKNVLTMTSPATNPATLISDPYGDYIFEFVKKGTSDSSTTDIIVPADIVYIKQICKSNTVKFLSKCTNNSYGFNTQCTSTTGGTTTPDRAEFTINIQNVTSFSLKTDSKNYMNILDNNFEYNTNQYYFKTHISLKKQWSCITSNGEGNILAAAVGGGNIWMSNDYGDTWREHIPRDTTTTTPTIAENQDWNSITLNDKGDKLAATKSTGKIWTYDGSTAKWTELTIPKLSTTTTPQRFWKSITSDSSGNKLAVAVYYGNIWTSTDFGVSWTERTPYNTPQAWDSITSSSDGKILTAVVICDTNTKLSGNPCITPRPYPPIVRSTNSGYSWSSLSNELNFKFNRITSNDEGDRLVATTWGTDGMYISTDTGKNWKKVHTPTSTPAAGVWATGDWRGITSNSGGDKLAALQQSGSIWTSTNSGVNWKQSVDTHGLHWVDITSNNESTKLAAVVYQGGIWTSTDSGVTWTEHKNTN
jgi:hypothetical protein